MSVGLTRTFSERHFTRFIQCCDEEADHAVAKNLPMALTKPEEVVLDTLRPIWFESKHGYQGTNHEEAELFCQSVGLFNLCPEEAVRSDLVTLFLS